MAAPTADHVPAVCASCHSVIGVDTCKAIVNGCGQLCRFCQSAQQGIQSCCASTEVAPRSRIKMESHEDSNRSLPVPQGQSTSDINSDVSLVKSKTTTLKRLSDEPMLADDSSVKVQKLGDDDDRSFVSCDLLSSLIRPPLHQWSSTEGHEQKDRASVVEGETGSQTASVMSSQTEPGDNRHRNEEASSIAMQRSTEIEEQAESRQPTREPSTGVCLSQETNREIAEPALVNQELSMNSCQTNQESLHTSQQHSYPNQEPILKGQHSFCTDKELHYIDEEPPHTSQELSYPYEEPLHPAEEPLHPAKEPLHPAEEPLHPAEEPLHTGQRALQADEEHLCTNHEPRYADENILPSSKPLQDFGKEHEGLIPVKSSDKGDTHVNLDDQHFKQLELWSKKAESSPEDLEPGIGSMDSDHRNVEHNASCTQLDDGSSGAELSVELNQQPVEPATEGLESINVEPGDQHVDVNTDTGYREMDFMGVDTGVVTSDTKHLEADCGCVEQGEDSGQTGRESRSVVVSSMGLSDGQLALDSRPVSRDGRRRSGNWYPGQDARHDDRLVETDDGHSGECAVIDGTHSNTHDSSKKEKKNAHTNSHVKQTEAHLESEAVDCEEHIPSPPSSPELYLSDPTSQSSLNRPHFQVLHDSQETLGLLQDSDLYMNDSFTSRVSDDTDEDSDLPIIQLSCDVRSPKQSTHLPPAQDSPQQTQEEEMRTREFCALSGSSPPTVLPPGGTDEQMVELRLMLDKMLTEKQSKLDDKQLAAQINQINEDLRKGGINKFSVDEVEETELLPEHKAKLKQFEIQNSHISGEAPGINLFHVERARNLFTFPQTLTLSACGFTPGRSSLDKMLSTSDPDCISELLNSSLIQMSFDSLSCPEAFMDWLFFVLSDLEDDLLSHGSLILLLDLLQRDYGKGHQWIPTTLTLARVFVNYGASLQGLLPVMNLVDFTDADLSLTNNKENSQPHSTPTPSQVLPPGRQWAFHEGLRHVLRVMAEAIHKRPHLYSVKDLLAITVMLLRVSIDKKLNNYCLMHDLKLCISAIFNAVPSDKWKSYIFDLCKLAPDLASHHHNLLQLVEVLPPSDRGITVQHHLSYVFLRYLCFEDRESDFMDVKMRDLVPIIRSFKVKEDTDFYKLYSLCVLLDRCICKKNLPASEKADLKLLYDMLKSLMGSVRECITDLDRSVVKEMLSQLIIILHIKLESMGFKQCTMYQYCQQTAAPQQQPLARSRSESSQSEDSEEEVSQSEASLNSVHCKTYS